jgi:hypothetical protein
MRKPGQGVLLGFNLGRAAVTYHVLPDDEVCHCDVCESHREYLAELEFLERQTDLFR